MIPERHLFFRSGVTYTCVRSGALHSDAAGEFEPSSWNVSVAGETLPVVISNEPTQRALLQNLENASVAEFKNLLWRSYEPTALGALEAARLAETILLLASLEMVNSEAETVTIDLLSFISAIEDIHWRTADRELRASIETAHLAVWSILSPSTASEWEYVAHHASDLLAQCMRVLMQRRRMRSMRETRRRPDDGAAFAADFYVPFTKRLLRLLAEAIDVLRRNGLRSAARFGTFQVRRLLSLLRSMQHLYSINECVEVATLGSSLFECAFCILYVGNDDSLAEDWLSRGLRGAPGWKVSDMIAGAQLRWAKPGIVDAYYGIYSDLCEFKHGGSDTVVRSFALVDHDSKPEIVDVGVATPFSASHAEATLVQSIHLTIVVLQSVQNYWPDESLARQTKILQRRLHLAFDPKAVTAELEASVGDGRTAQEIIGAHYQSVVDERRRQRRAERKRR